MRVMVDSKVIESSKDAEIPVVVISGASKHSVEVLQSLVHRAGFRLYQEESAPDAGGAAATAPDVVVMDVSEGDLTGQFREALRHCRSIWQAPILCLIPLRDDFQPHVVALLDVDDYLLKPVRPAELSHRIRVLIDRSAMMQGPPVIERRNRSRRRDDVREAETVSVPSDRCCRIDDASKTVFLEGRKLALSPKEYELFKLLASNAGRIVPPEEIIKHLWRDTQRASAADVHQYMHLLRRKVESDPNRPRWIITVRGFGYKLVIPADA